MFELLVVTIIAMAIGIAIGTAVYHGLIAPYLNRRDK